MPDTERPVFNQPLADRFLGMVAGLKAEELTEQRVKGLRGIAEKNEGAIFDALYDRLVGSHGRRDVNSMRLDLAVAHFLRLERKREDDKLPGARRKLGELMKAYLPDAAPIPVVQTGLPLADSTPASGERATILRVLSGTNLDQARVRLSNPNLSLREFAKWVMQPKIGGLKVEVSEEAIDQFLEQTGLGPRTMAESIFTGKIFPNEEIIDKILEKLTNQEDRQALRSQIIAKLSELAGKRDALDLKDKIWLDVWEMEFELAPGAGAEAGSAQDAAARGTGLTDPNMTRGTGILPAAAGREAAAVEVPARISKINEALRQADSLTSSVEVSPEEFEEHFRSLSLPGKPEIDKLNSWWEVNRYVLFADLTVALSVSESHSFQVGFDLWFNQTSNGWVSQKAEQDSPLIQAVEHYMESLPANIAESLGGQIEADWEMTGMHITGQRKLYFDFKKREPEAKAEPSAAGLLQDAGADAEPADVPAVSREDELREKVRIYREEGIKEVARANARNILGTMLRSLDRMRVIAENPNLSLKQAFYHDRAPWAMAENIFRGRILPDEEIYRQVEEKLTNEEDREALRNQIAAKVSELAGKRDTLDLEDQAWLEAWEKEFEPAPATGSVPAKAPAADLQPDAAVDQSLGVVAEAAAPALETAELTKLFNQLSRGYAIDPYSKAEASISVQNEISRRRQTFIDATETRLSTVLGLTGDDSSVTYLRERQRAEALQDQDHEVVNKLILSLQGQKNQALFAKNPGVQQAFREYQEALAYRSNAITGLLRLINDQVNPGYEDEHSRLNQALVEESKVFDRFIQLPPTYIDQLPAAFASYNRARTAFSRHRNDRDQRTIEFLLGAAQGAGIQLDASLLESLRKAGVVIPASAEADARPASAVERLEQDFFDQLGEEQ